MDPNRERPRVGVAAIVSDQEGRVVLGLRKGSHGSGQWALPGGHLEFGEEIFACAERETLEETGLSVLAQRLVAVTSTVFEEAGLHYITLFVSCIRRDSSQQPALLEPGKCEGWHWKSWDEIKTRVVTAPETVFLPIVKLVQDHPEPGELVGVSKPGASEGPPAWADHKHN